MAKICNYCGAEMPDSKITCEKCGLPSTGESRELIEIKTKAGIYKTAIVSPENKERYQLLRNLSKKRKLPPEIKRADDVSYSVIVPVVKRTDTDEYLKLRNAANLEQCENHLRTIKNCEVFFTVLAAIGLIGGFLLWIMS